MINLYEYDKSRFNFLQIGIMIELNMKFLKMLIVHLNIFKDVLNLVLKFYYTNLNIKLSQIFIIFIKTNIFDERINKRSVEIH